MKRNASSTDFKQQSLQITMPKPQNHPPRNTDACAPPICIPLPPGLCVQGDFRLPCSPGSGWLCLRRSTGESRSGMREELPSLFLTVPLPAWMWWQFFYIQLPLTLSSSNIAPFPLALAPPGLGC